MGLSGPSQIWIQGGLYTLIATLTPVGSFLVSDAAITKRSIAAITVGAVIAGATALKAFLSTTFSDSGTSEKRAQPVEIKQPPGKSVPVTQTPTKKEKKKMSKELVILEGCPVVQDDPDGGPSLGRVHFMAAGRIDADGGYHAYHPNNRSGFDDLRNAGSPGNWYGIVTGSDGLPIVQGPNDPAPGFHVSATSYEWPGFAKRDPRRYVDAETVPYIVVSPLIRNAARGIVLGCKARVTFNGKSVDAVVADIGPRKKIGELSIAAAKAVGIPHSARTGGEERKIVRYELWPGVPAVVNGVTYPLIRA